MGSAAFQSYGFGLFFKGVLGMTVAPLALTLYERLLVKVDNDRAEAYVLDCLRMEKREILNAEIAERVLDYALYLRKEMILEEVERVSAGAALLVYLLLR